MTLQRIEYLCDIQPDEKLSIHYINTDDRGNSMRLTINGRSTLARNRDIDVITAVQQLRSMLAGDGRYFNMGLN